MKSEPNKIKLIAEIERIHHFLDAFNNVALEFEIDDQEFKHLKSLLDYYKIPEDYISEFACFFVRAKQIYQEEISIESTNNQIRENVYLCIEKLLLEAKIKNIPSDQIDQFYQSESLKEKALSEEFKQKRDIELKIINSLNEKTNNQQSIFPTMISFHYEKGKVLTLKTDYFINSILQFISEIYSSCDVEAINEIIENEKFQNRRIKRKVFAYTLYRFILYTFRPVTAYKCLELVSGIMFFGGLNIPNAKAKDIKEYEIGKNNEEYRKYIKSLVKKPYDHFAY